MSAMSPTKKRNRRRIKRLGQDKPTIIYPRRLETFRDPYALIERYAITTPNVCNGEVVIHRYRVTIEPIDDSPEVLQDRLRKLWRTSEPNHHSWDPMREMARDIGMDPEELDFETQGIEHPRHHKNRKEKP